MGDFRPDFGRVEEKAQELLEKHHLPGLALGAVVEGEPAWQGAWGWADIAGKTAMTPEHRQRIASITKTQVGLTAMSLIEEARFSLDSRVQELLPDIPLKGQCDSLAVRHLLTHTGGIGEAPNIEDITKAFDKLFGESEPGKTLAELYKDGITVEAAPGSKWCYANHGFTLLGEIISRMEGVPLHEAVERRVYEPLGMTNTDLRDEPHPGLSKGYTQAPTPEAKALIELLGIQLESEEPDDGWNMPGKFVRVWGNPAAGGVQSTIPDMLRYASALLRKSDGIVSDEAFEQMTSPQYQQDPRLDAWGLAFMVQRPFGVRQFGHGGAAFGGWNSFMAVYPELNAAFVIHLNMWREDFDNKVQAPLIKAYLRAEDVAAAECEIEPQVLETAPGVYELPGKFPLTDFRTRFNPGRVMISRDGDGLTLRGQRGAAAGGAALAPADANDPDLMYLMGPAPSKIVLLRDGGGAVTGLRFQHLFELVKNPELQPWT
ncbi:MAG TPA: serine hydrolase domain-containing protein [Dehalococcoidia bacterium]|nr:serine hydrolase domain-containing protein [Dehalococcoidia bacterium]